MDGFFVVMGGCSVMIDGKTTNPHSRGTAPSMFMTMSLRRQDGGQEQGSFGQLAWFTLQLGVQFSRQLDAIHPSCTIRTFSKCHNHLSPCSVACF